MEVIVAYGSRYENALNRVYKIAYMNSNMFKCLSRKAGSELRVPHVIFYQLQMYPSLIVNYFENEVGLDPSHDHVLL